MACACHGVLVEVRGQHFGNQSPPSTWPRKDLSVFCCYDVCSRLVYCGLSGESSVSVLRLHHFRILTRVLGIELMPSAFTVSHFTHWAISLSQPPHPNTIQFLRLCPKITLTRDTVLESLILDQPPVFSPRKVCAIPSTPSVFRVSLLNCLAHMCLLG